MRLDDRLGHLVPPGRVRRPQLEQGLNAAMNRCSHGSVHTRYVVAMHPADLAWLDPALPDLLARALRQRAARAGVNELGEVEVEFRADPRLEQGRPQFWSGFSEGDLLVLADVDVRSDIAAAPR